MGCHLGKFAGAGHPAAPSSRRRRGEAVPPAPRSSHALEVAVRWVRRSGLRGGLLVDGDRTSVAGGRVVLVPRIAPALIASAGAAPVGGRKRTPAVVRCRRSTLVAESLRRSSVPVAPGPVAQPSPPAAPGARVEPSQPRWPGHRRAQDQVAPAHCPPSASRTGNCCRPAEDGRRQNSGVRHGKVAEELVEERRAAPPHPSAMKRWLGKGVLLARVLGFSGSRFPCSHALARPQPAAAAGPSFAASRSSWVSGTNDLAANLRPPSDVASC